MTATVRASAPCRVDLAGGTLDIWPLGLLHPGSRTVNLAVDLAVTVEVGARRRGYAVALPAGPAEAPDAAALAAREETALVGTVLDALAAPPLTVRIDSASPRAAGLGASSALTVALIAAVEALDGREATPPERRAALARDLEARLMSLPTGRQDHFPALLGGALEILHRPGGEVVRRLEVDLGSLGAALVVAYSGQSHFSAGQNWRVVRRRLDGEAESWRLFSGIAEVAERLTEELAAGDLAAVGRSMADEWSLRSQLAEGVSTPGIERLLEAARGAGAWGGKACGAGGGGCVAVLGPPAARERIIAAVSDAGGQVLDAAPTDEGLRVEVEGV